MPAGQPDKDTWGNAVCFNPGLQKEFWVSADLEAFSTKVGDGVMGKDLNPRTNTCLSLCLCSLQQEPQTM